MSTFKGFIAEFPDIRVDFFQASSGEAPLACFLSHVHSDHLKGLESFAGTFIYCSAPTKALLLKLERRAHRLNFAQGILEARREHYKHLDKILKCIPLETPTLVELAPGNDVQVTLFDANHCTGAVMFLFESSSNAVLYTGDIRSEPWFVNTLTRHPLLIEYTSGLRTLDCVYLDTSHTDPVSFPSKDDGLRELLSKVRTYPPDTVFHFAAWTFGYEDVWMALSKCLRAKVHVDAYKLRLYESLPETVNGPVFGRFQCGNTTHSGFLTSDESVRIHSCEKGMSCPTMKSNKIVWIRPIITRLPNGAEIEEIGIGGGAGDLQQLAELDLKDRGDIIALLEGADDRTIGLVEDMLARLFVPGREMFSVDDVETSGGRGDDHLLIKIMRFLAEAINSKRLEGESLRKEVPMSERHKIDTAAVPRTITFPYSRHSSYEELCHFVRIFKPKDVYPCTVDELSWYHAGKSIEKLFGKECSGNVFRYDVEIAKRSAYLDVLDNMAQRSPASTQHTRRSPSPVFQQHNARMKQQGDAQLLDGTYIASEAICQGSTTTAMPIDSQNAEDELMMQMAKPTVSNKLENSRVKGVSQQKIQLPHNHATSQVKLFNDTDVMRGARTKSIAAGATKEPAHHLSFWDDSELTAIVTPPHNAVGESPGSESQRQRRKLVLDALDDSGKSSKRIRLTKDCVLSSPSTNLSESQEPILMQSTLVEGQTSHYPASIEEDDRRWRSKPLIEAGSAFSVENMRPASPLHFKTRLANNGNSLTHTSLTRRTQTNNLPSKDLVIHETLTSTNMMSAELVAHDPLVDVEIAGKMQSMRDQQHLGSNHGSSDSSEGGSHDQSEAEEAEEDMYYDGNDEVIRCIHCRHELWMPTGRCLECDQGLTEYAYFEVGSEDERGGRTGPQPLRVAKDEWDSEIEDGDSAKRLAGDYLDNDSDAYDSLDSINGVHDFPEEYDCEDDFIDDDDVASETDTEETDRLEYDSCDSETDYEVQCKALQAVEAAQRQKIQNLREAYWSLSREYEDMEASFVDLKRAVGVPTNSINEDGDEDEDEDYDEDGNIIINVEAPEPTTAEIVVSELSKSSFEVETHKKIIIVQADEQSQNSLLDESRLEDRVRAYEAAEHDDWHEVKLMSTSDNHTHPEVEL